MPRGIVLFGAEWENTTIQSGEIRFDDISDLFNVDTVAASDSYQIFSIGFKMFETRFLISLY